MGIGHIKTAEQRTIIQQYGDWYWVHWPLWVGCYIWYSGEGTGRGPSPSRPLLAVPNGTAHPSTVSVQITALLYNGPLLCGFNVPIKCYTREPNRPKWVHLHQASKSNFGLLWPWPLTPKVFALQTTCANLHPNQFIRFQNTIFTSLVTIQQTNWRTGRKH